MVVRASDVDDDQTLTMNAHGLPRGAEIRVRSRGKSGDVAAHLRWRPAPDQVGDHLITFVVNDSGGRQRFGSLAVTVEAREPKSEKTSGKSAKGSKKSTK